VQFDNNIVFRYSVMQLAVSNKQVIKWQCIAA